MRFGRGKLLRRHLKSWVKTSPHPNFLIETTPNIYYWPAFSWVTWEICFALVSLYWNSARPSHFHSKSVWLILHQPAKTSIHLKKCNLTLLWAHLPVGLTIASMLYLFTHIMEVTHVHLRAKFGAHRQNAKSGTSRPNNSRDMIFFLVKFGRVTYRQKVTHKSPPCISTGGLKNDRNSLIFRFQNRSALQYERLN